MRPEQLTPENERLLKNSTIKSTSFNEAGAINSGKSISSCNSVCCVGKASMRPEQLTPENGVTRARGAVVNFAASMRPEQLTPENNTEEIFEMLCISGFNEAGAINSGKYDINRIACADCVASMRPEQLTPENRARQ